MRKNSAGFTILEVILAITVLTLAVGGSFILISQTIGSVSVIQSRLIASYLIQEGLEIVRNIRDSNWLKNQGWDQGLPAGDWEADYTTTSFDEDCENVEHYNCHIYDDNSFLKIPETDEFYNYSSGTDTIFKRKITISKESEEPDRFKVSVEVFWREKGQLRSLAAQEYLYNWYSYKEEMPQACYLDGIPQTCDGAAATALGCTAGEEACRRCDNGVCTSYTSGQHGCETGYECNVSGYCVSPDVCTGIADNTQVPGCDELCQACQNSTCGFADAGKDPGNDCTGVYSCSGFITRLRNMCNGSGACADIDAAASDCSGTCASYCSSGNCINTDTDAGTCTVSTKVRVSSGGNGYCSSADCIWNLGYDYRKQITIDGSTAGAQTNYQMKLTVYKGSGTDSAGVVYLNNHCRDDFNDIRFTKSDGVTGLDHWRESYTSGTSAVFWIEFDPVPASPGTVNFYIYYDNSSASSASNFDNTFTKDFGESGLAGLWHMDEGSGSSIADNSGNGNTGTFYGSLSWEGTDGGRWGNRTDIKFATGSALYFSGDDTVVFPNSASLDITGNTLSLETWMKITSWYTWGRIMVKGNYPATTWHYSFGESNVSGVVSFGVKDSGGGSGVNYSISLNEWHHVVGVYNNGLMSVYVDGSLYATSTAVPPIVSTGVAFSLGHQANRGYEPYIGVLDEVRVYNRVLSAGEIVAHYERRKYASPEPTWGTWGSEE